MDPNDLRRAFEAWATSGPFITSLDLDHYFFEGVQCYTSSRTQALWYAFRSGAVWHESYAGQTEEKT